MFGYLTPSQELLSEDRQRRYQSVYCGLCRCIKARHGQLSRLALDFDMCFLVLLLSSLYEPEEREGENGCLRHPMKPRPWMENEFTQYAADMNIALARLKCLDDWQDEGSVPGLAAGAYLKGAYEKIKTQYPRQCAAIENSVSALSALEKQNAGADEAAAAFGMLMAEVLTYRDDRWSGDLRAMGMALGRFIYIMDACMDLDGDTFHNRYNPFRRYYGLQDNARRFEDILKMLLGECLFYFDRLPLVQDVDILKNILCVGLWAQFNAKYKKNEKGCSDGNRPV